MQEIIFRKDLYLKKLLSPVQTCNFIWAVQTLRMKISENIINMGFYFCIACSLRSNYWSMEYIFPVYRVLSHC